MIAGNTVIKTIGKPRVMNMPIFTRFPKAPAGVGKVRLRM